METPKLPVCASMLAYVRIFSLRDNPEARDIMVSVFHYLTSRETYDRQRFEFGSSVLRLWESNRFKAYGIFHD